MARGGHSDPGLYPDPAVLVLEASQTATWVVRVAADMAMAMKKNNGIFNRGQFVAAVTTTHHKESAQDIRLASLLQKQGKA